MSAYQWDSAFTELFNRCLEQYKIGNEDFNSYYSKADLAFLKSIGCMPRELFDFVEDLGDGGEPTMTTAVMIASVRRDYLEHVMEGQLSEHEIKPEELPSKGEELEGFVWLRRIIMKARGKLRGELDPDIMFGCGGDRHFFRTHDIAPSDFLRAVWAAGDDDSKIVDFVNQYSKA